MKRFHLSLMGGVWLAISDAFSVLLIIFQRDNPFLLSLALLSLIDIPIFAALLLLKPRVERFIQQRNTNLPATDYQQTRNQQQTDEREKTPDPQVLADIEAIQKAIRQNRFDAF